MGFSITNKYLIRMKRNLHFWMLATILIISGAMQAQNHKNHPVDVRMDFYKLENDDNVDKNSYSLFTYLDADGLNVTISAGYARSRSLRGSGAFLPFSFKPDGRFKNKKRKNTKKVVRILEFHTKCW